MHINQKQNCFSNINNFYKTKLYIIGLNDVYATVAKSFSNDDIISKNV